MKVLPVLLTVLAHFASAGDGPDPLQSAYEAARSRQYDAAIRGFRQAIEASPDRPAIRKDLGYVYLKTGENVAAREQFAEVTRLDPADFHAALEYAFLCHETGETGTARRVFDRIRKTADPESRATAETAFQNIDQPLAEGIARWSRALELGPDNFSAHYELAKLAEQRDDLALAAVHYEKAWRLRRELRNLLVCLGRVWTLMGQTERANAALLAASRGAEPRAAEAARPLLPKRYPYVYEFRKALDLDTENAELRRELAYLLLAMNRKEEAEKEFTILRDAAPDDALSAAQLGFLRLARNDPAARPLLEKVLHGSDKALADRIRKVLGLPRNLPESRDSAVETAASDANRLAERSYKAGYLKDAEKYFTIAHESDPLNFPVMLQLGRTYNVLGQDRTALRWFDMARKSPDPHVATEAERSYRNLRPAFARFRTSIWLFPSYSSRWRDLFSYGQAKTEIKLGALPLRGYLSTRFIGDTRQVTNEAKPQYLSESSVIAGVGLATNYWRGAMLWGEAGSALSYTRGRRDVPRMAPDYRGGIAFSKGFGHLLGGESRGMFFETNDDGVFVSRFQNDVLLYSQNRWGYTLPRLESLGGLEWQFYWSGNASGDVQQQYWANVVETGPGVRFRWKAMPPSWVFAVNALRGAYTSNAGNPRGPNFFDLRAGFWYSHIR